MSENEFSHIVKLADIGSGATKLHITADADQRTALAKRFDLETLDSLQADLSLLRDSNGILAQGRFTASLAQHCIATGDPVPAEINEALAIRFLAEPVHGEDAEIELDSDDCDTMFHDGQVIDLGEAVAQSMGLALDPYPRSANAEAALKKAGVISEETAKEEASPFGALAALRDKLRK